MITLQIEHPRSYPAERRYILALFFQEWLGFECHYLAQDRCNTRITIAHSPDNHAIEISDGLMTLPAEQWLSAAAMPKRPIRWWTLPEILADASRISPTVPVLYGYDADRPAFEKRPEGIRLNADLLGSAFFMLTRYEELVMPERDEHDRFPVQALVAYQEGFFEQPIVDEYVEILWQAMQSLWPGLERRRQEFRLCLSHDIDNLLVTLYRPPRTILKNIVGDFTRRRDPLLAIRRIRSSRLVRKGQFEQDPANTFDYLMERSEQYGVKSTFNFYAGGANQHFEPNYDIDHPWIQDSLTRIHQRGHELGIHLGYNAYRNEVQARLEYENLRRVAEIAGVRQQEWGGRHHWLRWQNPTTWQIWDSLGLDYDATLGYSEQMGFRCGTCQNYPVFDLINRCQLRLREQSLTAMDHALLMDRSTPSSGAFNRAVKLAGKCKALGGCFCLLWHNCNVSGKPDRKYYEEVLNAIAKP